jgi:receptor protein-tyrosine kinase
MTARAVSQAIGSFSAVHGSAPGAKPDGGRVGSVVERAIAKMSALGRSALARPAVSDPAPAGLGGGPAVGRPEPARPRSRPARDPTRFRVVMDAKRLARAGMFTPGSTVNRTTEEFRLIKRAVLERIDKARAEGVANANLVMVTSTREGEGKTFVALNLAFSLAAEQDRSVVLIDADPAKSSVAQYLQLPVEHGLIDLLQDDTLRPDDLVLPTSVASLSILPAGPRHALGAELFASERMGALLRNLCLSIPHGIMILDAPPVLATSEPSALARHVDQTILVVEADKTSRAAIVEALNLIGICPHIGLVLNKARFRFGAVRFGAYYKSYYKPGKRGSSARS